MVARIVDEVVEVADRLRIPFKQLSSEEAGTVVRQIASRFADSSYRALWERLVDTASVHDAYAWHRLDEHVGHEPCAVIIEDRSERYSGVHFSDGAAAIAVLIECSGFVFYVVPEDLSYVLCSNDHDMLIGAGTAKEWVMSTFREHGVSE